MNVRVLILAVGVMLVLAETFRDTPSQLLVAVGVLLAVAGGLLLTEAGGRS